MNITVNSVHIQFPGFSSMVPSSLEEVETVCSRTKQLLSNEGLSGNIFAVDLLLREFLNNAIVHGHHQDRNKRVRVTVQLRRKWIVLRITDQGEGFDWRSAKREIPGPEATSGRGLAIATNYANRIQFNDNGSQATIWIKKTYSKESTQ
jgi:serine/threonine-protein kinase RsbW